MEVDLSQCLIARKGEVMACRACGAEVAILEDDLFADGYSEGDIVAIPPAWLITYGGAPGIACPCGEGPMDGFAHDRPRIHLSTGWRELGGEAA